MSHFLTALLAALVTLATSETRVQKLHITSNIQSRFATTLISSKVLNVEDSAKEVTFGVVLPNGAFISNFTMLIDGKLIVGEVKEKEKAKKDYEAAKSKGQSTGLVAQAPRESNTFRISVNVAANDKVDFELTYQELLKRVHGVYKHQINFNPEQTAEDMNVTVIIEEKRKILDLKAPKVASKLGDKTNKALRDEPPSPDIKVAQQTEGSINKAELVWTPSTEDQKSFGKTGAQMVVLYDVERGTDGGEIETVNGYFVHYFAPEGLKVGSKHVVFVLDRSGSMRGTKMEQLKQAMKLILDDLKSDDQLSIVTFSSDVSVWKPTPIKATSENVRNAKKYIEEMLATGGTNIHSALETGIKFMNDAGGDTLTSMIVFLTDGLPTAGKTSSEDILGGVNKWNKDDKNGVHSISFGNDADFSLLKKVSVQNKGLARKVYEDSDAELQLTGFYDEISSPLLADLDIKYLNETVDPDSVVHSTNAVYSEGSEVVSVGKVNTGKLSKDVTELSIKAEVKALDAESTSRRFICGTVMPCYDYCYPRPMIGCPVPYLREDIVAGAANGNSGMPAPGAPRLGSVSSRDLFVGPAGSNSKASVTFNTTASADFDVNWNTASRVAKSRDQCARICFADKKCKLALYTPAFNNCLLSYEGDDVYACSTDDKNSVHSISFGNDADFTLLKQISVQNAGLARKVYEDSDAELQLTGFYDEISSPLLAKLDIKYLNDTVDPDSVVHDADAVYSEGSEVVTVGKIDESKFSKDSTQISLAAKVTAFDADSGSRVFRCGTTVPCWDICHRPYPYPRCPGPKPVPLAGKGAEGAGGNSTAPSRVKRCIIRPPPCHFPCPPPPTPKPQYDPLPADTVGGFVERMWAYLTIQKLLEEANYGGVSEKVKDEKTEKALEMSLRYNFVTELTSMVVVKPDQEEGQELKEEEADVGSSDDVAGASSRNRFGAGAGFGGGGPPPPPVPNSASGASSALFRKRGRGAGIGVGGTRIGGGGARTGGGGRGGGGSAGSGEKLAFSYNVTASTDFNVNWNTISRVATSRAQCARMCAADDKCKIALFTPAFNNCLLSYEGEDVFGCDKAPVAVDAKSPAVLYCISG